MITALMLLVASELVQATACQPLILKCEEMAYRAKAQCLKNEQEPAKTCADRQRIVFDYCISRVEVSHPKAAHCFQGLARPDTPSAHRPKSHP